MGERNIEMKRKKNKKRQFQKLGKQQHCNSFLRLLDNRIKLQMQGQYGDSQSGFKKGGSVQDDVITTWTPSCIFKIFA